MMDILQHRQYDQGIPKKEQENICMDTMKLNLIHIYCLRGPLVRINSFHVQG